MSDLCRLIWCALIGLLRSRTALEAEMDLFVVPTISFRLLYGFLILQHSRRQLLWLGVTARPSAHWIARQLTEAYAGNKCHDISFAIGIASMAMSSSSGFEQWVYGIGRSRHGRHGKTDIRRG
jgi:hypothetical protein